MTAMTGYIRENLYDCESLLKEAAEKALVPATVGFVAAGPAGATASAGAAFILFFTQKVVEEIAPELKGNRYLDGAFELASLGYTSLNSALLMRHSHFCISLKTGITGVKTGNFAFDVAKSALAYFFGKSAQSLGDPIASTSFELWNRRVKAISAASVVFHWSDLLYASYYVSAKHGSEIKACDH